MKEHTLRTVSRRVWIPLEVLLDAYIDSDKLQHLMATHGEFLVSDVLEKMAIDRAGFRVNDGLITVTGPVRDVAGITCIGVDLVKLEKSATHPENNRVKYPWSTFKDCIAAHRQMFKNGTIAEVRFYENGIGIAFSKYNTRDGDDEIVFIMMDGEADCPKVYLWPDIDNEHPVGLSLANAKED